MYMKIKIDTKLPFYVGTNEENFEFDKLELEKILKDPYHGYNEVKINKVDKKEAEINQAFYNYTVHKDIQALKNVFPFKK